MYKIINRKKLWATRVADAIGWAFAFPRKLFQNRAPIQPEAVTSILVIRTAYIGDVIMTLPLLAPLRRRFPQARISFLTCASARAVLSSNPYVDEVITYDPFWFHPQSPRRNYLEYLRSMKGRHFDLVIETRADIRELLLLVLPLAARYKLSYNVGGGGFVLTHVVPYPGLKHKIEYHLDIARFLGDPAPEAEWGFYLQPAEQAAVIATLTALGVRERGFVALHPGSRLQLKRWRDERYAALSDWIQSELGLPVLLLGSPDEQAVMAGVVAHMTHPPLDLVGKLSLRQMAGVVEKARLFICNDSAPLHVGCAMKVPTLAIFGPSKSVETGPFGNRHQVAEREFPCRFTCDESHCHHPHHHACMEELTLAELQHLVRKMLEGVASP